jgi:hypothetical protein
MAIVVTRTKALHRGGAAIPAGAPSVKPYVTGELPLPTFTGNGSGANIAWSDGGAGGTFAPAVTANNVATTYTPSNESKVVVVTATDTGNGANTGQNTVTVESTLPLNPAVGYETDTDQETEVSYAKDKNPDNAVYFEHGVILDTTPLQWMSRSFVQWQMMRKHWEFHKKTKKFWFIDQETNQAYKVRWTSALRQRMNGAGSIDMSGTVAGSR